MAALYIQLPRLASTFLSYAHLLWFGSGDDQTLSLPKLCASRNPLILVALVVECRTSPTALVDSQAADAQPIRDERGSAPSVLTRAGFAIRESAIGLIACHLGAIRSLASPHARTQSRHRFHSLVNQAFWLLELSWAAFAYWR